MVAVSLFPLASQESDLETRTIDEVHLHGLHNVRPAEMYGMLTIRRGQPYREVAVNHDLRSLFNTGYFSNVFLRIETIGDDLVRVHFEFHELPRIESIEFLGVEGLFVSDLKLELPFRERDTYSPQKVRDGLEVLRRKYRDEGFFLAEVWVREERLDPNSNAVTVTYVVDEGESIPIARINIIGTRNLDPVDIVRFLESKEKGLLETGTFREEHFEQDKMKIIGYAKMRGYVDAEIDESGTGYEIRWNNPRRPEDGRVVVVTYKINEGEIRHFGGYSLEHDASALNKQNNPPERRIEKESDLIPIYSPEGLLSFMELQSSNIGEVLDESRYFRDREQLQEAYATQGYVFAQIQPIFIHYTLTDETLRRYEACFANEAPANDVERRCKEEAGRINLEEARRRLQRRPQDEGVTLRHIHFIVRENDLAYIENIIVKGMVKTQEHVIRREILVKEGQLYNQFLVNRSRERIHNLGFFKEVNMEMRPGSDDRKLNLIFDVEEQPTGTISLGGGYGTQSGFSIFTELGESNLGGTGQSITGRIQYGPYQRSIQITWNDPWFYERCQATTGSFWRNKMIDFDNASDLPSLAQVAETLQNNYADYGKEILAFIDSAQGDNSIESLDLIRMQIRVLIGKYVEEEEDCYRSVPRPWSLSLWAFYNNMTVRTSAAYSIRISNDPNDFFEGSSYDIDSVGVGVGTMHTFLLNWAHYHRYSPSWSTAKRPTALVNNEVLKRTSLGWQFKSSLTHGLIYDSRDSVFNPTRGFNMDLSVETVGGILGGEDHFNRYNASFRYYHWWFDYTFGGLIRNQKLRRWRVVQQFRLSGSFTHETSPFKRDQNKEINPFIEAGDKIYMGGYEDLRGYDWYDPAYPAPWRSGASHQLLLGTELRFPIEPSMLWLVAFFDGGALYNNIGEAVGEEREYIENYRSNVKALREEGDLFGIWYTDTHDPWSMTPYHYNSSVDWNDPRRSVFSERNVALDRMLFSWGVGLRVQIPMLPLRLYLAQKLYYDNGSFKPLPGDSKFHFVFGISDMRF